MIIRHSFKYKYCIAIVASNAHQPAHCQASMLMSYSLPVHKWSDGGLFGVDRRLMCANDSMLTPKALNWDNQKGVYYFCTKKLAELLSDTSCFILKLMSVPGYLLVRSMWYVNPVFFFIEVPLSMLDQISIHFVSDGCWSLWYSHFTFRSTFEHVLSIWFQTSVWRFPYLIMEDWIPKIIEKRWRLFTPDFLSNM